VDVKGEQLDWADWRRRLGRQVRRIRELVGYSQEQLAQLAGVSQAAVSRLEAGRGLATPLLLLMKVYVPLARALRGLDSSMLNEDIRWVLEIDQRLQLVPSASRNGAMPVTHDPGLEEMIRLYQRMPSSLREPLIVVARAMAAEARDR
jgi:transcriptional regulator with XRE-family HTH domain